MSRRSQFETIRSEGALLPVDLLQRVGERDKDLGGLRGEDYGLPPNEPLNEAIVRSWNRLVGAWGSFREAREKLPEGDPGTTITRDRWLLVLLQELGYGRVQTAIAIELQGKSYAVSHAWGKVPIHLVGCRVPLDRRSRGVAGAATQSPHGTVQELLNRSDERLWGLVSNGLVLRVLRDNSSLTRHAYLEFDLEQMLEGEVYADFVLLWLMCHASRVEGERPHECWLERWSQGAVKRGTRALDGLRRGVEEAIAALGSGFLRPGSNGDLRAALRAGDLSTQDYYRELLRLVYRLLFLFVAEDRGLLLDLRATEEARARYAEWYSTRRLRELAGRRRGTKHGDLYAQLQVVMRSLGNDDGCPPLGLPPLGSFLWSDKALPHLDAATLPNTALLDAIRALATVRDGKLLRSVDYKNLGAEELGSVYESLLELHPELDADAGTFALTTAAGNERKTTGSYYTPSSLIACLLDTALDPVLDEAAARGVEAILALKICDPACGSGHFLIAAAHRIAKRLASVCTGDEEPSPEATRGALRDVVSRCLYGVDVNPMAVELCKVSLWMEALDPGRPLSFLDAHVKCGNSLLGTTAALIAEGVPDEAFKALEGDDKEVARALRKQNKTEREGQLSLEDETIDLVSGLQSRADALEQADDATPEGVHAKERLFRALFESDTYERAKLAADSWCAAFVQRKTKDSPRITTGVVRRIANETSRVLPATADEIRSLAAEYAFFHWEIEYPGVFGRAAAGFDVVLGNPPWERVKLQEKEFFAGHPEIAGARTAGVRKRLVAALEVEDPSLHASWVAAQRRSDGESQLLRLSRRYPLCGRGDVNTSAVFAELMSSLVADSGRCGNVLPLGIATDDTTKHYFADLVQSQRLGSLYGFENEDFLFPGIDHRVTFCLMTTTGSGRPAEAAEFAFFCRQSSSIAEPERGFTLTRDDFALLNPNTLTCPVFRTRRDADLTKSIYERVPCLVTDSHGEEGNPWRLSLMRMFDANLQSHLFHAEPASGRVALYEAKMIHLFDHRFGTYQGQTQAEAARGKLPELTEMQHEDATLGVVPRNWVDALEVDLRLADRWNRQWLLGWRDITRNTNVRSVIVSAMPRCASDFTMRLCFPTIEAAPALLLACLGSFVVDFVARQKIGGTHLADFVTKQLPVLPPSAFDRPPLGSSTGSLGDWIAVRVIELVFTSWDMEPFGRDHGYGGPPFRWDSSRRALLRAELDAVFFHLYGLMRGDVDYVMDAFWIVRDRDVRSHGEFRTKRLILEIYDELAEAVATGQPYQTRLNPPPADPSVAHPPKPTAEWAVG